MYVRVHCIRGTKLPQRGTLFTCYAQMCGLHIYIYDLQYNSYSYKHWTVHTTHTHMHSHIRVHSTIYRCTCTCKRFIFYYQVKLSTPSLCLLFTHLQDLSLYMNPSLYCVYSQTPFAQVFNLFRTMGLRHLPVLDGASHNVS